jgi:hypothetical protein
MNDISDFSNALWRKSARSGGSGCVEVATLDCAVGVRDSKNRQGAVLVFRFDEWNAFLAGVRDGEFDLHYGALDAEHRKNLIMLTHESRQRGWWGKKNEPRRGRQFVVSSHLPWRRALSVQARRALVEQ